MHEVGGVHEHTKGYIDLVPIFLGSLHVDCLSPFFDNRHVYFIWLERICLSFCRACHPNNGVGDTLRDSQCSVFSNLVDYANEPFAPSQTEI